MSNYKSKKPSTITLSLIAGFKHRTDTFAGLQTYRPSLESLEPTELTQVQNTYEEAEGQVRDELRDSIAENRDIPADEVTEEEMEEYAPGIEAAALILTNGNHLQAARHSAISALPASDSIVVNPISGSYGSAASVPSLEAFDVNKIDTFKAESITYNLQAVRQDAFAEMFYRTYVGSPDQAMFIASIDRIMIAPRTLHTVDGEAKSFNKRHILEAYRNHEILDDNSTQLVPVVAKGKNDDKFVDVAVKANSTVQVGDENIITRPLLARTNIGLIGISSHPGLIAAGLMDQNEQVDHNAGINSLIVAVKKGADVEHFEFNVKNNPASKFIKTAQGHGFDALARLRTVSSMVTKETNTTAGVPSVILESVVAGGQALRLRLETDADINFERSTTKLNPHDTVVDSVRNADGSDAVLDEVAGLEDVTFSIVGWTIDARRTNSTRRSAGHRVDYDLYSETYPVGLLAPIVAQAPASPYAMESKMKALIQATHVRINNSAVTALLNTAEHLKSVVDPVNGGFITADSEIGGSVEGIARMVLQPHFRETTIELDKVVASLSSKDKLRDVQGHFIGVLNECGYRMVQKSGYAIASRALNGGVEKNITLLIGTDEVLPSFMMIQGDDRTLGIKLKYQIESSSDQRMFNKIVLALGTDGQGFQPLHFGNFLWIPELVSDVVVARGGSTLQETMVQPRFRHICNTPVMEVINVTGLTEVVAEKLSVDINRTDI